jgi:hypothetical protein
MCFFTYNQETIPPATYRKEGHQEENKLIYQNYAVAAQMIT